MKKLSFIAIKFLFLCFISCSVVFAEIIQTDDLKIIQQEVFSSPKDTIVVFDVDFVLITPTDEVFILTSTPEGGLFFKKLVDDLWSRLPKQDVDEIHSIVMLNQHIRTVTPDTQRIFKQIQDKGYRVLGLTACGTGPFGKIASGEEWRIKQLQEFGFTFNKSLVNAKPGELDPYIPNVEKYYAKAKHVSSPATQDGIIFTTVIPKGEVLDAYLQFAKIRPNKIIFIDDRVDHLVTVAEYCKKSNIEYVGYEYTAIKQQAKNIQINRRRAMLQYKVLELTRTWINDTQADQILGSLDNE